MRRGGLSIHKKEKDGHITTAGRRALSKAQFALPAGEDEQARGIAGRYPIDTTARARNALSRSAQALKKGHISAEQHGEIQKKVHEKYPDILVSRRGS